MVASEGAAEGNRTSGAGEGAAAAAVNFSELCPFLVFSLSWHW